MKQHSRLGGDFLKFLDSSVTFKKSSTMYKFGAGGLKRACSLVTMPMMVGAELCWLEIEVVPGSLDLLLSKLTCGVRSCIRLRK